jgi:N-methylhydantoinase A
MLGSGPAAGIVGSGFTANERTINNVIATDMGGTSFDVGIIYEGAPVRTNLQDIGGFEFFIPAVEVRSIGSGGGSIVWAEDGRLGVGPESAGSDPGPVAYGQGGTRPTVTDCALLLGYLPTKLLGGRLDLDVDAAREALGSEGAKLGLDAVEFAAGAMRVVNSAMAELIRQMTTARGLDPRDFAVVSYGGAGPLHVAGYAGELGVSEAIVPHGQMSSTWSAFGAAISEMTRVFDLPLALSSPFGEDDLQAAVDEVSERARTAMAEMVSSASEVSLSFSAEMRWDGQLKLTEVPLTADHLTDGDALVARFAAWYETLFGANTVPAGAGAYLQTLRCVATIGTATRDVVGQAWRRVADAPPESEGPPTTRDVHWPGKGFLPTSIYRGEHLASEEIAGPAVLESMYSTMLVEPGQRARGDAHGNIILTFDQAGDEQVMTAAGGRAEESR